MDIIGQATIDIMAYFMSGFTIMLVVSWIVSLFAFGRDN